MVLRQIALPLRGLPLRSLVRNFSEVQQPVPSLAGPSAAGPPYNINPMQVIMWSVGLIAIGSGTVVLSENN